MRKSGQVFVAGAMAVAIAAAAGAVVSFDGKSTSFHTITAAPLAAAPAPFLVGTIAQGKKARVLKVDAMVTSELMAPFAPWSLNAFIEVNGVFAVDPTTASPPFGAVQDCSSDLPGGPYTGIAAGCTVSGTWIFDIDAAEIATPGCCYNVPLAVTLWAGPATNAAIAGIPASASLSVKMEKKK